jgi:hypothetical protein
VLLSRLDATSDSVLVRLIPVLLFSALLSLYPIRECVSGDPQQYPTKLLFDNDSFEKALKEAFPLPGRVDISPPVSARRKTGSSILDQVNFGLPPTETESFGLSPGAPAKPSPSLGGGQALPIGKRSIPETTIDRSWGSGALKPVLAGGAIYRLGSEDRDSRLTMDFLLPARLGTSSSLFFESRAEYQNPFSHFLGSTPQRFDLGLGLGWRKLWQGGIMLGMNSFWDSSRLYGDWYSSPGFGLEFAVNSPVGVWDLILNAYRGGGIDLKGGFTFPIWEERLDVRIYAEKYRFFDGEFILGSKAGVEISSPDRFITVSYAYGQDSKDPEYHAVACSLAVPFRLENIFRGKNPFEQPERPDRGHRYTERLQSAGVKRAWRRHDTVVEARSTPQGDRWTTPGKLTDLAFSFKKPSQPATQTTKAVQDHSTNARQAYDWNPFETKKRSELDSMVEAAKGVFLLGLGTYIAGDYGYRNAFGPFEIEPYEQERIKQEMPKKKRHK